MNADRIAQLAIAADRLRRTVEGSRRAVHDGQLGPGALRDLERQHEQAVRELRDVIAIEDQ